MGSLIGCGCCGLFLLAPVLLFLGIIRSFEKQQARQALNRLLQEFVFGGNRTQKHVNRIHALLTAQFVEDDTYQDLIRATGSFVPGGEPPFLNEEKLAAVYAHFLKIPLPESTEGVWPPPPDRSLPDSPWTNG